MHVFHFDQGLYVFHGSVILMTDLIYVIVILLIYCTQTQVHMRKGGVYATLTPHEIKHLTVLQLRKVVQFAAKFNRASFIVGSLCWDGSS